jgi:hypothetical protein
MSIADKIEEAALGPTPERPHWTSSWVDGDCLLAVEALTDEDEWWAWVTISNNRRRMFLLSVAESLRP